MTKAFKGLAELGGVVAVLPGLGFDGLFLFSLLRALKRMILSRYLIQISV